MSVLSPTTRALVALMTEAPRGPKREGFFALWLTVRLIEDLELDPPQPERAFRRRVTLLEQRLSSLTLPHPLRRGLVGALATLRQATGSETSSLLHQLTTPVRDALGPEAAEVLAKAAKSLR